MNLKPLKCGNLSKTEYILTPSTLSKNKNDLPKSE